MNDKTIKPDQTGDILTYEVSDEVLEAAATRNGKGENFTRFPFAQLRGLAR